MAQRTALPQVSWFNRVGLALLVVGITYLALRGQWVYTVLLALVLGYLAYSVLRARRGAADDSERVNAAQPFDERDASVSTHGFALVGQVAILAQFAYVIWLMGRPGSDTLQIEGWKLFALALVMGVGNWLALRRA